MQEETIEKFLTFNIDNMEDDFADNDLLGKNNLANFVKDDHDSKLQVNIHKKNIIDGINHINDKFVINIDVDAKPTKNNTSQNVIYLNLSESEKGTHSRSRKSMNEEEINRTKSAHNLPRLSVQKASNSKFKK